MACGLPVSKLEHLPVVCWPSLAQLHMEMQLCYSLHNAALPVHSPSLQQYSFLFFQVSWSFQEFCNQAGVELSGRTLAYASAELHKLERSASPRNQLVAAGRPGQSLLPARSRHCF